MSEDPQGEKALDFGPTRIIKGHGPRVRLPFIERLRAARRVPQAVVKITSFAHGAKKVRELMRYISRSGRLELESDTGEIITTVEQQREVIEDWSRSFDKRRRSRDAAHIVFSMPRGSDPEALRRAVRTVASRHFAGHAAVWAIHEDRQHPHAHMILVMRGRDRHRKLEFKKSDLYRLREVFAEAACEQGVELAVSPRAVRGVGQKGLSGVLYRLKQRGVVPKVQQATAREVLLDSDRHELRDKPWEIAMKRRNETERRAYLAEAERLRAAGARDAGQRDLYLKAAGDLERFAADMPAPRTLRQSMIDQFIKPRKNRPGKNSDPHPLEPER